MSAAVFETKALEGGKTVKWSVDVQQRTVRHWCEGAFDEKHAAADVNYMGRPTLDSTVICIGFKGKEGHPRYRFASTTERSRFCDAVRAAQRVTPVTSGAGAAADALSKPPRDTAAGESDEVRRSLAMAAGPAGNGVGPERTVTATPKRAAMAVAQGRIIADFAPQLAKQVSSVTVWAPKRDDDAVTNALLAAAETYVESIDEEADPKKLATQWLTALKAHIEPGKPVSLTRDDWLALKLPLQAYQFLSRVDASRVWCGAVRAPTQLERIDRFRRVGMSLCTLVGKTPLLLIHMQYRGLPVKVYAKLESPNISGSVKDRMAAHIIRASYESGALKPGDTIVEASSGNTGIAFAALGRALGHPVRIYMPSWMSEERRRLITSYGAEVRNVTREEGGFIGSIALSEKYAAEHPNVFLPRQFSNPLNAEAHRLGTGREIIDGLATRWLKPDAFVAGVGTGGTVMGVMQACRDAFGDSHRVYVHPLEPANSPTLREGKKVGAHRIQGISDDFIPPIVHLDELDPPVDADDGDAILLAQQLSSQLGLSVGISSGANLIGAIQVYAELAKKLEGREPVVVTVLPDSSMKYLSTAFSGAEPAKPHFVSPHVSLEAFELVQRT